MSNANSKMTKTPDSGKDGTTPSHQDPPTGQSYAQKLTRQKPVTKFPGDDMDKEMQPTNTPVPDTPMTSVPPLKSKKLYSINPYTIRISNKTKADRLETPYQFTKMIE